MTKRKKINILLKTIFIFLILYLNANCKSKHIARSTQINCVDLNIICNGNKVLGKIFNDADSSVYSESFQKLMLDKAEAIEIDSFVKAFINGDTKTTNKIKSFYDQYFKQFLYYKDNDSNISYIKISFMLTSNENLKYSYWTTMDDGGDNFFYVKIDWTNKKVINYVIN